MTTDTPASREQQARPTFPVGCGPACPTRDWVSGICERHGPTASDLIVKRATDGFRSDLRTIMGDNRDER